MMTALHNHDCLLWVSSSLPAVYHLSGCFRVHARRSFYSIATVSVRPKAVAKLLLGAVSF